MNKIKFKDLSVLHICKPSLKNTYISVNRNSEVVLKTSKVSISYIEKLLNEKENWIRKQLLKREQNPYIKVSLEDEVLLFGEIYSIDTDEAKELRALLNRLRKPNEKNILKCYDNYYKIYAQQYLTSRLEYHSTLMNLNYKEIKYKKMRGRWGSCNLQRVITLNTQLLKLKKEHIDYVIVHELSHLIHMNHSRDFHSLVRKYIPDEKNIRKEIKSSSIF